MLADLLFMALIALYATLMLVHWALGTLEGAVTQRIR